MSTKEIELEIKRKEVELRILRKKLSVIQKVEASQRKDQGLLNIAKKYQSEFSKITDEDIDQVINDLNSSLDNWEKE